MKIGRNEPCPCGSGKKYKQCCLRSGKYEVDRSNPAIAAAHSHAEWEMAFLPIPANVGEGPHSRPTVVLVTAGPLVVHTELVIELSVEIPDLAREMARHLALAVERMGARPARLRVDEGEVVEEFATRLSGTLGGVEVVCGATRNAYDAWRAMTEHVFRSVAQDVVVTPTWGSWQQPVEWIRAMFSVAERYYLCRPWVHLDSDVDLVDVELADGAVMTASIMGSAGENQGLALTTDRSKFFDEMQRLRTSTGHRLSSEILALSYLPMSETPPEARSEVRKLRLPLAGPPAYPILQAMGSRAGGLPRDRAERFLAVLQAFAECFEQEDSVGELMAGEGWQSADGSVRFAMPAKKDPLDDWPGEVDTDHLQSGRTVGPGADWRACEPFVVSPEETIFDPEEYLESFRDWLEDRGFSESTVRKHLANARHLFGYLTVAATVRPEAMHEFDLRAFLYDWYPLEARATSTEARSLHASLEKLLTHLEQELDLEFHWAPRLLRERETFQARWQMSEQMSAPGLRDPKIETWRSVFSVHLDALAMLPRNRLGDDADWGETMGMQEFALYDELLRRWLRWRDDAIDRGVTARNEIVALVAKLQRTWETTPHESWGGQTPYQVILAERRAIASKLAESRGDSLSDRSAST